MYKKTGMILMIIVGTIIYQTSAFAYEIHNDPWLIEQNYIKQSRIEKAWAVSHNKTSPIVAIIDEGVDFNHPELSKSIWINEKEIPANSLDDDGNGYIDDTGGYNFISNSNFIKPLGSHGTFIAGIIAAEQNNKIGISGIATSAKIMPLVACDASGCDSDAVLTAIRYAADMKADIINLSLGGSGWDESVNEEYRNAIAYAYNKGSVLVIAAGNGFSASGIGKNMNVLKNAPVCNDDQDYVVGVAAVGENGIKSKFSDFGKNCVDVVATGENLLSTTVSYYNSAGLNYAYESGTSFAAAVVSGVAALVKSNNPELSNKDIIDVIKKSAVNVDHLNKKYAGQLGVGLVNAEKAVLLAQEKKKIVQTEKYVFKRNLSIRSSGVAVKELQVFLKNNGYFTMEPTGYFGVVTQNSLKSFQVSRGLKKTGILDLQTRNLINDMK